MIDSISIAATVAKYPSLPYQKIKEEILGKRYNLSLVFIGKTRAVSLNNKYRNKTYTPNILSFPLDTTSGEIFITPELARTECKKFGMTPKGYIGFLFIHGLLHLKGHAHGDTMERAEKKYVSKFKLV